MSRIKRYSLPLTKSAIQAEWDRLFSVELPAARKAGDAVKVSAIIDRMFALSDRLQAMAGNKVDTVIVVDKAIASVKKTITAIGAKVGLGGFIALALAFGALIVSSKK